MLATYAVSCDCQMFQVNFIPFLVSTFWRRNVPNRKTGVWFFALCSKRLSFCVLSRPPMKIRLSIGGRNLHLADDFLIGWFPSPSISAHFSVLASKIFVTDVIRNQTSAEIIFWPLWQMSREYRNLQLISPRMFRVHFVINYGKISEHCWTPHCLDKYSWPKNARLLAPAICMLRETTEETWRWGFALIVTVKRCGRFIITGKSVLYFKSSGKVKRDQLAGGFEF